ncbi:ABC transporter permease [Neobacillus notoginsengisoli]|uniref:ABC transporter permease n=1 Tax=Neobacillus notoginsengisoli TaxID=1578198 RepID=A0A417YZ43_9BACI|nr:ABC transporter permease [Neobacillus notoginsengisoli]RHW43135.1 ABC transporter permease [Neobacillus notoginsengisoli]
MFDGTRLWKERAGHRVKELGRYLKYIFNGHIVIVLLFLLGTAAYYYQEWLKTLDTGFPSEMIGAIVFGLFLTLSPVYNFLREADKVFLLPLEEKLSGFFLRSSIVSGALQSYVLLMLLALFMPLFAKTGGIGFSMFLPTLLLLLAVKAWNIAAQWKVSFQADASSILIDKAIRFLLNAAFSYLLFAGNGFLLLVPFVGIMFAYLGYFHSAARGKGLQWEALIAGEEKRMMAFYRLANLFTDVPHLKENVKRRSWLDFLLSGIPFVQKRAPLYLLARTFLRAGDYLGLSIRLSVIGSLGIILISYGPGQIFFALLFLYLTGFQLMPLASHHENNLWSELYPVAAAHNKLAFQRLLSIVLIAQTAIFTMVILVSGKMVAAIGVLALGAAFTFAFVKFYSVRKLKN